MLVSINETPGWGFGNRVFYYNNLRQYAARRGYDWSCIPWDGYQYFKGNLLNQSQKGDIVLEPCLGDNFFEWSCISTRSIFEIDEIPKVPENTCAVHFRGGDFHQWNAKAVLNPEYYINSIDQVKDDVSHFRLFTDDHSLSSFQSVIKKLELEKISYDVGDNSADRRKFINDFSYMTECEYIISSPSTYCIAAGFIGKNKKIIHSERWLLDRINHGDKFWIDLFSGGNQDYKLWAKV